MLDADNSTASTTTPVAYVGRVISPRQKGNDGLRCLSDVVECGPAPPRARSACACRRSEDWDDRRFQGRLVRRLLVEDRRRRVGRVRSAGADRPRGVRRAVALPIWTDFMRRAAGCGRPRSSSARRSARAAVPMSYLRPVEGCPIYTSTSSTATTSRPNCVPSTRAHSRSGCRGRSTACSATIGKKLKGIFR